MAASSPKTRKRGVLTPKGKATRAAILDAAYAVITDSGYYGTSVAAISRRCGVSMGTFYLYFRNKEQVLLELNDRIVGRFTEKAHRLTATEADFTTRLQDAIHLLLDHTAKHFVFQRTLGELELIDGVTIGYYETIARVYRDLFRREAQAGNSLPIDPNIVAYGLIGICYFNAMQLPAFGPCLPTDRLVPLIADLLLNGICGPGGDRLLSESQLTALPEPLSLRLADEADTSKGAQTRKTIFQAAERVFARQGANRANIAEITREAGVAQGTFYIHFKSKKALIEGFVRYINHLMRRELQRVVLKAANRLEAERLGMLAFYCFIGRYRAIYRVVPESETIDRGIADDYYTRIAQSHAAGLEHGVAEGSIRDLPSAFLARSLMGVAHFIALKWIIWTAAPQPQISTPILADIVRFLFYGLAPSPETDSTVG